VIHFYTVADRTVQFSFFPFTLFESHPLSLISVFFLLFAAKNSLGYFVYKMQYKSVYAVATRLSKNNLLHFLQGSYDDHVQVNSAVYINKISRHPIEFAQHVLAGIQQIAGQSILIILAITAILIFNPLLFLLLFCILTPPLLLMGALIKRKLSDIRKMAKHVHEKTLQHLQEALAGYIESNVYGRNTFFINRYTTYQARFNDFLSQQLVVQNLPFRFMEVFAVFGLFTLIVLNFYIGNTGNISLVTIAGFMAAAYKIIPGIIKILNNIAQIKTFGYTITGLLQTRAVCGSIRERGKIKLASIAMQNICFSYKGENLINDLSLKINEGDFIGLTGISGKGKTTVINLILGFLDQNNGDILINENIAWAKERSNWRERIGYVKQGLFLINDSILTNIILNEKVEDKQRLENAVKVTGLDILTAAYPEGLDKIITENGRNISGGQRQRIVIARALYKNSDLIILDEPFNELDRGSENMLLDHFRSLANSGKMIILITHNKESLSFCNKIISLDEK
jgi:ABC-type multidrug transport system fused ATPase/permease subunit